MTKGGQGWAHSSGWKVRAGNAQNKGVRGSVGGVQNALQDAFCSHYFIWEFKVFQN